MIRNAKSIDLFEFQTEVRFILAIPFAGRAARERPESPREFLFFEGMFFALGRTVGNIT
jgi:hypothetical protein